MDPEAVYIARDFLHRSLAQKLYASWQQLYTNNYVNCDYQYESHEIGRRALQNIALAYMCAANDDAAYVIAQNQFNNSNNMTDTMGALMALNDCECAPAPRMLGCVL